METNISRFEKDLDRLICTGDLLFYRMALDGGSVDDETKKILEDLKQKKKLPDFREGYETWYSEARQLITQVLPERLDDFVKLYKNEKRKEINFSTYTLSDYMIGLQTSRYGETVTDQKAAVPKFKQQVNILKATKQRFKSSLFDIKQLLQAEIFDTELDSARELLKKGFLRAAGAISGVVLEGHLLQVCQNHKISIKKKTPTINDYNETLREHNVIEIKTWRFIQHLADIRNLCDHKKQSEPTIDDIKDLIEGVDKISKSVA